MSFLVKASNYPFVIDTGPAVNVNPSANISLPPVNLDSNVINFKPTPPPAKIVNPIAIITEPAVNVNPNANNSRPFVNNPPPTPIPPINITPKPIVNPNPFNASLLSNLLYPVIIPSILILNKNNGNSGNNVSTSTPGSFLSFAQTIIGDGITTIFTINHNLNSKDVIVQVRDLADSSAELSGVDNLATSLNSVQLVFYFAPAIGYQLRVLILVIA